MSHTARTSPAAFDPTPVAVNPESFDETWYLQTYPDVAAAVARGGWKSGSQHFDKIGRERGRFASAAHRAAKLADHDSARPEAAPTVQAARATINGAAAAAFDPAYYAASYPLVHTEIETGLAADARDHYDRIGKHRGYLGNRTAPRPENPARWQSRFGGFWTDQANALDLVAGKRELGTVTTKQAERLRRFITDGYVVLENAIPNDVLNQAEEALHRAYRGETPNLLFNIDGVGRKIGWQPDALVKPAKALDLHWLSRATRNLIFTPELMDFLHLVMERRVFATQTLAFWRGSAQGAHQDSAYVNYSHPMQFLASWIALEDVSENSGELFYYAGSQRMTEYLYLDRFKGVEEAARMTPGASFGAQVKAHLGEIPQRAEGMALKKQKFQAKRGDILIWAADLAHGGSPISVDHTRKSVVTHYTTAEAVPSYFESRSGKLRSKHWNEYYSSSHYDFTPLET